MPKVNRTKTLKPIRPNLGIEVSYRRVLYKLLQEMHDSMVYWLTAAYKQNEPELAQDASPAMELRKAIRGLGRRWLKNWNKAAPRLAKYFAQAAHKRSDFALRRILKDAGIAVDFRMTKAMNDVLQATVNENVALIRSIPQQYLTQVEGLVMRSVQSGRDLAPLAKKLEANFGVTKRRAALIARDQNNKATAALTRARHLELGIEQAIWLHSHAGKDPRPAHVKMDGKKYDVKKGMWDPDEQAWCHPGELINCRCLTKPIVPGFS